MKTVKILFVVGSLTKGGAATGARNLLSALKTQNLEIIVIEADKQQSLMSKLFRFAERLFDHFCFNSNTHFFKFFKSSVDLRQLVSTHRPDVIQLCNVSGNLVDYSYYTEDMPAVFHRMSDFWPYKGCQHYHSKQRGFDLVDRLFYYFNSFELLIHANRVAPSHWLINELAGDKKFASEIDFIPNAVSVVSDLTEKHPTFKHVRVGFISGDLNEDRKGLKKLLRLVDLDNFELHLFGAGRTRHLVLDHCEVIAHGRFEGPDLSHVYSKFDILLCSSSYDNSPNVVLEAMCFGVPVIGSVDTGMESYIISGTGHLFDFVEGSTVQFLELIAETIANYATYRENCLSHVRSYSAEKIGAKYLQLYKAKLAGTTRTI